MPLTKANAAKLTQDQILRGVIEVLITESRVLQYLPFITVNGASVRYNREAVLPTAAFYAPGDTWSEDAPQVLEVLTALRILGGDADVDNFLQQTYHNPNDIEAITLAQKAKVTAYEFSAAFFTGDSGSDPNSFDGLNTMAGAVQTALTGYTNTLRAASNGANGATLTLDMMDQFIDAVKPGRPQVLFMSKRSRRKLSSLRRASGNLLETDRNEFGLRALYYDGIPIEIDENIPDDETQGTSGDATSIYAVQFDAATGIVGFENGGITVDPIGNLETKDAKRWRIKWYTSIGALRLIAFARLAGVRP